ncbi:hypothetical protein Lser_V15G22164 [Lactuca serriola]
MRTLTPLRIRVLAWRSSEPSRWAGILDAKNDVGYSVGVDESE